MTLHHTVVTPGFVLVVGDRLVTRRTGASYAPFDAAANKTLLVLGQDANVVVSYTGLAYIDGKPTDQRLAEYINGPGVVPPPPMRTGGGVPAGFGPSFHYTLKQVLDGIRDGLNEHFPVGAGRVIVQVTGWALHETRIGTPVHYRIQHSGKARTTASIREETRSAMTLGPLAYYPTLGQQLSRESESELHRALQDVEDDEEVETLLVAAIRHAARSNASIGTAAMAVCIARNGEARTRFHREPETDLLAYSPAVMGRGAFVPPQVALPTLPLIAGEIASVEWSVAREVDPPFPPSGAMWAASQPRTSWG